MRIRAMPLTLKRRLFVNYYLGEARGNASQAARLAGYAPRSGPRLLAAPEVQAAVVERVTTVAMAADDVLRQLTDYAQANIADFLTIDADGNAQIDLDKARTLGKLHLIKKIKTQKTGGAEIELYDSLAALGQL